MEKKKLKLITHDGSFHADDIFAAATLVILFERQGKDFEIVRTRKPELIEAGDYVFDVGGIHDEATNRFDHHQVGGAGKRSFGNIDIEYAAFGLVWKKFGAEVCESEKVAEIIEKRLVAPIDAGDNGMSLYDLKSDIGPYTTHSLFEGAMKPTWQEDVALYDEYFLDSVKIAKIVIQREIIRARDKIVAEAGVIKCYEEAEDKRIVILDKEYPIGDVLNAYPEPLFAVSQRRHNDLWSLMTLRADSNEEFKNRKDLPASWAGLRDEELQKITGVDDAVFCHRALFLAVAKSKEGAIKLAQIAVES